MGKASTKSGEIGRSRSTVVAGAADFGSEPLTVGILLWPDFPMMSLAGLVESLRHAGDHGDASKPRYARWDILGGPSVRMVSSCGIEVGTTSGYPDPSRYDFIFVIGGLLRALDQAPQPYREYIRASHRAGVPVVGVCTGSFVLAEEGLLDGRSVCVHPYHERDFTAAFPRLRKVLHRDYVTEGSISTVLGGVSILPFMKRIIGARFGPDHAAKTVHQMTLPAPDGSDRPEAASWALDHEIPDARIRKAVVILEAEATRNPRIADLARGLGLSERHFLRLFRAQVGRSPKDYVMQVRLRAAIWMLRHTSRSITQIAYEAGFASGASLADHCHRRLKATPSQIRKAAKARLQGESI